MLDIHGALWQGPSTYSLVDSAERYEQYELNFAAKVRSGRKRACDRAKEVL